MNYQDAKRAFEEARRIKDQAGAKAAWAAMESASDAPKGPSKKTFASKAGQRQAAERSANHRR